MMSKEKPCTEALTCAPANLRELIDRCYWVPTATLAKPRRLPTARDADR
jgi:hypothetical protein